MTFQLLRLAHPRFNKFFTIKDTHFDHQPRYFLERWSGIHRTPNIHNHIQELEGEKGSYEARYTKDTLY
jgi:hypothetical protein